MISDREVVFNNDATATIHLATCGLGQLLAEVGVAGAVGPDQFGRLNADFALRCANDHLAGPHGVDAALGQKLDAVSLQSLQGC